MKQVMPRPAPPEPPKPNYPAVIPVFSPKAQEDFDAEAGALADKLGFKGDPNLESPEGIRVEDARNYLRMVLHEVHQDANNEHISHRSVDEVCEHLHLTEEEDVQAVRVVITKALERERKQAPQRPALKPIAPLIAQGEAHLVGDAGMMLGNLRHGEEKARGQ